MSRVAITLIALLLVGCAAPSITPETADKLPPYTLCKEYRHWSDIYAAPTGYSKESILKRLNVIYASVKKRKLDCKSELRNDSKKIAPVRKRPMNCFPNAATGGVTCL